MPKGVKGVGLPAESGPELPFEDALQKLESVVTAMESDVSKSPPNWENPASIDITFYEKIWKAQKIFSLPIHSRPNIQLFFLFISLCREKNESAKF